MGPRDHEDEITPHTRPPADDDADHMLVRTVRLPRGQRRGRARLRAVLRLRPRRRRVDAGRRRPPRGRRDRRRPDVPAAHRHGARHRGQPRAGAARAARRASSAYCALSWAEGLAGAGRRRGGRARRIDATTRFWRTWLGDARIPDHRWREPLQRSALTIKGLTYMPTGATVAALTTSLPETPGGERNWDYRYTWMRDTTFTLQALHWLEPRLGGRRVHAVRRRPRAERGRLAADHVRHRRPRGT